MTVIYNLIFYFILYSVVGWIMESTYRSICEKKLINSGFMIGPYCPIYGFGALIMIGLLQNLKSDITLLFCTSFVVLSFWEYLVGMYLEKVYHTRYWDYSNRKINIQGRVCLLNSVYWGILGVIFTKVIHPLVIKFTQTIPTNIILYIDISLISIMVIDTIVSSIKVNAIEKQIEELKELTESIKEKLSKPKTTTQIKHNIKKNAKVSELEQLQLRMNKLKITLYKQITKMKNAFPTMQSDIINKFTNEKIDIKELKEKIKSIKKHSKKLPKAAKKDNKEE